MLPETETLDSKKSDLHLKLTFTLAHVPFQFSKRNILTLTNIILSMEAYKLSLYMSANQSRSSLNPSQILAFTSNSDHLYSTLQPLLNQRLLLGWTLDTPSEIQYKKIIKALSQPDLESIASRLAYENFTTKNGQKSTFAAKEDILEFLDRLESEFNREN